MTDIFDYPVRPEMPFLEELAQDLEGAFHVIAHAGHEKNLNYILERQKYFRSRYGRFLKHVNSDVGIFHILPAYDAFQDLLEGNPKPEEIIRRCEDCLSEHLTGEEPSEEYLGAFQEFYDQDAGI